MTIMLYDQLDPQGAVVRRGFALGMRDVLPTGHQWVPHVPPVPTQAELMAQVWAKARHLRMGVFTVLDGLQASAITTGSTSTAQAIEAAKQALRDLPQTLDLSAYSTRQQMEQAVLQAYWAIAMAAPPQIQSAFNSLVP